MEKRKQNGQAKGCTENRIHLKKIGARIAKSLFFWGMAAVLASSAYTDLVKLSGGMHQVTGQAADSENTAPDHGEGGENAVSNQAADKKNEAAGQVAEKKNEAAGQVAEEKNEAAGQVADGQNEASSQILDEKAEGLTRKIALTFDDGPHPVYTKKLLEGLAQRHVEATFFVVGKNIPGNEDLIRQMEADGHLIGNHTYDHVKICDMNGEDACEQVEKTSTLIREITGKDTEFVRPPFGAWNKEMECSFTMIPVLWDVDPLDWTTSNTQQVVQKVMKNVEENDIILLHDCYDSSVEAALEIVDELLAQGYEFVTVEELILE